MLHLYKAKSLLAASALAFMIPGLAEAQYCTPTINNTGLYIMQINFSNTSGYTGGQLYPTGNSTYSQTIGSTSGTQVKYFGGSFFYSINNPTSTAKYYDLGVFVDWNNDNDFDDAFESWNVGNPTPVPANGNLSTGNTIIPPLNAPVGNHRVRIAVSQNGTNTATACGSYTGEVEDYIITIAANNAPVLNTSVSPIANKILSTQTNSNGISIGELIGSTNETGQLISDPDDNGNNYYTMVPRGIAITGLSASNGSLQYKIGTGSWTNVGAVSTSNALLLLADASNTNYKPGCRIRFVPTGEGTPSITIKAWDGTTGTSGDFANITATGGTTAFSTANATFNLPVISNTGYTEKLYIGGAFNNINTALYNPGTNQFLNSELLLSNVADYYASDLDLDATNNKLFWISGTGMDKIASSDTSGNNVQLSVLSGLNYSTGLAVGNHTLYYWDWASDYSTASIKKATETGTGITTLHTPPIVYDTKDVEFYNNKVYFQYSDDTSYRIASVDTNGNNFTVLYSTANFFGGFDVANDTLYWTEGTSTAYTLFKKPITGSTVTTIATGASIYTDLVVDPASSKIYYVTQNMNSNDSYSLLRAITTGGSNIGTLATFTGAVGTLGFINPVNTPLAISLVDFNGAYNAAKDFANLQWESVNETSGMVYTLERSIDGKQFSAITSINGKGNKDQATTYTYDDNLQSITAAAIFYRLKQTEKDGNSVYSKIVKLEKTATNATLAVYPNPGKGNFNVRLSNTTNTTGKVQVYNSVGTLVNTATFNSSNFNVDLSANAAGLYTMQITFDNGAQNQIIIIKE